jgi:hypothetical protein
MAVAGCLTPASLMVSSAVVQTPIERDATYATTTPRVICAVIGVRVVVLMDFRSPKPEAPMIPSSCAPRIAEARRHQGAKQLGLVTCRVLDQTVSMDAEGADPSGFAAVPEDKLSRSKRYKWAKRLTLGGCAVFLVSMLALVATLAMSSSGARYGAPPMATEEPEPLPTSGSGDVLEGETAEEYRWRMASEENLAEARARVDYLLTSDFTGAEWFEQELLSIREHLLAADENRTFANQARQDNQEQSAAEATTTEVAAPPPEAVVEQPEGQGAVVFVSVTGAIAGLLGAIAGVFTAAVTYIKAKRHPAAAESD